MANTRSLTFKLAEASTSSAGVVGVVFLNAGWFSRDHFSLVAGSDSFLGATTGAALGFSSAIAASVREMTCSSSVFSS